MESERNYSLLFILTKCLKSTIGNNKVHNKQIVRFNYSAVSQILQTFVKVENWNIEVK